MRNTVETGALSRSVVAVLVTERQASVSPTCQHALRYVTTPPPNVRRAQSDNGLSADAKKKTRKCFRRCGPKASLLLEEISGDYRVIYMSYKTVFG
jgi:hypothetical protein